VRLSRIRLLPRVFDGEAHTGPRVKNPRPGKKLVGHLAHCDPLWWHWPLPWQAKGGTLRGQQRRRSTGVYPGEIISERPARSNRNRCPTSSRNRCPTSPGPHQSTVTDRGIRRSPRYSSARRGKRNSRRRAHHAGKDRVGTWEVSGLASGWIPRVRIGEATSRSRGCTNPRSLTPSHCVKEPA
jgi:hypothetical protein